MNPVFPSHPPQGTPAAGGRPWGAGVTDPAGPHPLDLTLFVACYNEEANIRDTLDTVVSALREVPCSYEVIVVDDKSRDYSVAVVQQYQREHPELPIYLKINSKNQGLARNFVDCSFVGRGKYYKLICGDNVEPRESLVNLFRHLGSADLLVPYHERCVGKSASRVALSRWFTQLVNLCSGYRLRYYNGMAVYLRYHVMRWHSYSVGLGFQAELVTHLLEEGATYREVFCPVFERQKGSSTAVTLRNLLSVAHSLFNIACRRVRRQLFETRKRTPQANPAPALSRALEDPTCQAA
jgi:glycosyltransferase involved in cell wall biosynthesis